MKIYLFKAIIVVLSIICSLFILMVRVNTDYDCSTTGVLFPVIAVWGGFIVAWNFDM